MSLITLKQWAVLNYGMASKLPSNWQLADWARKGCYHPAAIRRGGYWWMREGTVLLDPRQRNKSQEIRDCIAEIGPCSMREITAYTGIPLPLVSSKLGAMRESKPKQIFIAAWRRDEDGGRLYIRALYKLGDRGDRQKPPPLTRSDYNQRAKARFKTVLTSVFDLAIPAHARRVTKRAERVAA